MSTKSNIRQIRAGLSLKSEDDPPNDSQLGTVIENAPRTPGSSMTESTSVKGNSEEKSQLGQAPKAPKISITKLRHPTGGTANFEVDESLEKEVTNASISKMKKKKLSIEIDDGQTDRKGDSKGKGSKEDLSFSKKSRRKKDNLNKKNAAYFAQESEEDGLRINEYDAIFKPRQFLEFLFYHFIFFFVLGPFSFIVLYLTAGKTLTKNMGFAGINVMFINQCVQWALLFSSVFLYVYTDHGFMSPVEIYMIASAVFLRICTIASKYGSMHPLRIKIMKSRYLTYEELTQDYMLIQWRDQTDEVIEQELLAAIRRHDVDTSLFYFNFIANANLETKKKLLETRKGAADKSKVLIASEFMKSFSHSDSQNATMRANSGEKDVLASKMSSPSFLQAKSDIKENFPQMSWTPALSSERLEIEKNKSEIGSNVRKDWTPSSSPEKVYLGKDTANNEIRMKKTSLLKVTLDNVKYFEMFSGVNLAREILHESKKESIPRIINTAMGIGLARAIIPMLFRVYNKHSPVGTTPVQIYMSISYIMCITYFFSANAAFVLVGLSDLSRKFYLMTQLSNLISVRKVEEYETVKAYPTINIFDPFSLRTWISLRKIFMDFGRKYFMRINLNISIFLIFYVGITAILLLEYFGIIKVFQGNLMSLVAMFEGVIMIGLMIKSVVTGAYINDHFRVHQSILQKNKTVLTDLLQLDDVYFSTTRNNFTSSNIIYQEGVNKIKDLLKLAGFQNFKEETVAVTEDFLLKLVTFNNNAIEELEFEQENNPVKMLGFVTDKNLVKQILAGLFTLAVAIIQKQIGN